MDFDEMRQRYAEVQERMRDLNAVGQEHEPDWDALMELADGAETEEARARLRMQMIQLRTNHLTGKHLRILADNHAATMTMLLGLAERLEAVERRLDGD